MRIRSMLLVIGAVAGLTACAGSPIKQLEGQTSYTQLNLWVDNTKHLTTNYKRGWRLPINSRVEIGDTSSEAIKVRVPDEDREFTIVNIEGYSGQDIEGISDRYFADTRRDLSGFSSSETEHILDGDVEPGMSKEAVLVARGYPPAHETGSTDSDRWKYWTSRFDTVLVTFQNGRVSEVKD